jgi:hypothetical protein
MVALFNLLWPTEGLPSARYPGLPSTYINGVQLPLVRSNLCHFGSIWRAISNLIRHNAVPLNTHTKKPLGEKSIS